jgi:hypothetical protein
MFVIIHEPGSGKFMVIKGRLDFIHIGLRYKRRCHVPNEHLLKSIEG